MVCILRLYSTELWILSIFNFFLHRKSLEEMRKVFFEEHHSCVLSRIVIIFLHWLLLERKKLKMNLYLLFPFSSSGNFFSKMENRLKVWEITLLNFFLHSFIKNLMAEKNENFVILGTLFFSVPAFKQQKWVKKVITFTYCWGILLPRALYLCWSTEFIFVKNIDDLLIKRKKGLKGDSFLNSICV